MKILITGGAGFIGSHLADRLLEKGNSVLVIDNFATSRRDNLTPHKNLTLVEGTIADTALVEKCFSDFAPEVVVHAAAAYKNPDDWQEDAKTNVLGATNVVRACMKTKTRRVIYFQTSLCYGIRPEEQPITLKHGIRPGDSSYAISKTAAEYYLALSGLDFISFRLANAYGPRNLSGPLPTFYHRLTNSQKCFVMNTRRDFIFVDDLVSVVLSAIEGKGSKGYYHISSGKDFSIEELYRGVLKALGRDENEGVEVRERNPDDTFTILLDPSKTNKDFGWQTTTTLSAGIPKTIAWYQKHGIQQTFTHLKAVEKH